MMANLRLVLFKVHQQMPEHVEFNKTWKALRLFIWQRITKAMNTLFYLKKEKNSR